MQYGAYNWIAAVGLIATVLSGACRAWAPPLSRGPSIQFSNAKDDTVSTNLNSLTDRRRNNLKRLEEDLNRPLQVLDRNPAVGGNLGAVRPPAGPIIQSKKVRELLERQRNWAFETPEDQIKGLSDEEIMNMPQFDEDEGDSSKKSALDRYYETLKHKDGAMTNSLSDSGLGVRESEGAFFGQRDSADPAQNAVRTGLGQTEQSLRQLVNQDSNLKVMPELGEAPVMPDLFYSKGASSWQTRSQELRIEQFRQSLQADSPTAASPLGSGFSSSGATLGSSLTGAGSHGGASFNISPPQRSSVPLPGSSSFSSAGLSAAPSLSPVRAPAYTPPSPTAKKPPSLFTEMPRPRF